MRTTRPTNTDETARLATEETPGTLSPGNGVPSLGAQLDAYEERVDEPVEDIDPVTEQRVFLVAAAVAGLVLATGLGLILAVVLSLV